MAGDKKKAVTEGFKSYATFGWSDYSKGKAPYQSSGEALVPPPPEIPALPVPELAKPMPVADDAAVKAAQRRSAEILRRQRGRQSTILSDAGDLATLGG